LNSGGGLILMEDNVYVLDYLAKGRGDLPAFKRNPVVYGIGESQFTFLELIPKRDATFITGERIYVGKDPTMRTKIEKIKGRVNFEDLTSTAHGELPYVLLDIVHNNEARYVKFFNEASAISTRYHVLELLPGLGKKMMIEILDERKKKPFTSFKEMQDRIDFLRSPDKLIAKRIELELTDPNQKYRIFTRLPLTRDQQY
jgi:putative nucleotide binding protein